MNDLTLSVKRLLGIQFRDSKFPPSRGRNLQCFFRTTGNFEHLPAMLGAWFCRSSKHISDLEVALISPADRLLVGYISLLP
jgi:hypothetical protein